LVLVARGLDWKRSFWQADIAWPLFGEGGEGLVIQKLLFIGSHGEVASVGLVLPDVFDCGDVELAFGGLVELFRCVKRWNTWRRAFENLPL
jgi:hypothetical protein